MSIDKFVHYCLSFYGEDGLCAGEGEIFDPPATVKEISQATERRKKEAEKSDNDHFEGDSTDREYVRDYILQERGVLPMDAPILGPMR